MLQDPKLLVVPPRKVAPLRQHPTRTTGVSICKHTEWMLHSDGRCCWGAGAHFLHLSLTLQGDEVTRFISPGPSPSQTPKLVWTPAQVKWHLGACHTGEPQAGPAWLQCFTTVFYLGDLKKFDRTSSSGTMSSCEELGDQEAGLVASAFDSGEGPPVSPDNGRNLNVIYPAGLQLSQ